MLVVTGPHGILRNDAHSCHALNDTRVYCYAIMVKPVHSIPWYGYDTCCHNTSIRPIYTSVPCPISTSVSRHVTPNQHYMFISAILYYHTLAHVSSSSQSP